MLRFDVRELRQGSLPVEAVIPYDDPVFQGLELGLQGPVLVSGELQAAGRGSYQWRGEISGAVRFPCRRCLTEVEEGFAAEVRAIFSADEGTQDEAGVYLLPEPVTVVDLTAAVRDEVGLAAPTFVLCRMDCAGLCPRCGSDLNEGPCQCGDPEPR